MREIKTLEKAYCEKCDKDVAFKTSYEKRTATIRETTFNYLHIIAKCKECGERVYPVSIGRRNEIKKYNAYRKKQV